VGTRDPRDGLLHAVRAIVLAVIVGIGMAVLSPLILWLAATLLAAEGNVHEALATYFYIRILGAPLVLINFVLLGWFYGRAAATTGMALQMLLHGVDIALSAVFVLVFQMGVAGAALGTLVGEAVAVLAGLILFARRYGGVRQIMTMIAPGELREGEALRRLVGLNRDLMIRSISLMTAYGWFAAQGSRMGEVALSANGILLNLLMVVAFFQDGIAQAAEQLSGKAYGANWKPAFDDAYRLSFLWGLVLSVSLGLLWYFGGDAVIAVMTTNEAVRAAAHDYLWIAALTTLTFMPAFVFDGILIGLTQNVMMRNGMVLSLGVFMIAALLLQPSLGNLGLWLSLHIWFATRGVYYWVALERRRTGLFA
jgi:MATE family multidrug resistance protein